MLIISGITKSTKDSAIYTEGNSHRFTLFSSNEDIDASLTDIETFMNELMWDDIVIIESEACEKSDELTHETLKQAFAKAERMGMALVINNEPISKAA